MIDLSPNQVLLAKTVRNKSRFFFPYGKGKHAPVCGEDLARVIVGILVAPQVHRGKTYIPTGPRSLSMNEMAAVFGRVLGNRVEYFDLPVEHWAQILAQFQMPPYLIEHLSRVAEAHQRGEFDAETDVVQSIGGASPKSLETFITENRATLA